MMTSEPIEELVRLTEILRSPVTGLPLTVGDACLESPEGEQFAIVDGVPLVVAPSRSLFGETVAAPGRPSAVRRARSWIRRRLTASANSRRNLSRVASLLRPQERGDTARRRVLVVGGGILGFGVEVLDECQWVELVETDVYIGPRTRLVCDAHDLPFSDGVFAGVVIQAVLEHVVDPVRVIAEVHRVLATDGLVYSEVPFMQQVHEGAYDFTRWTLGGHRRLLRDFDELDAGVVGGPGEALAWSLRHFLLACAGGDARLRGLVSAVVLPLTLPLRWLDRLLRDRPAGADAASGTYILGRKRETPRTDAEIVAAYRGALGVVVR